MRCTLALLVALALAACGGEKSEATKPSAPPATEPAAVEKPPAQDTQAQTDAGDASAPKQAEAPKAGGHVTFSAGGGRAHWVGAVPAPKTLEINPETSKDCHHAGGAMDESDPSLLVDAGGGIANVVIEVELQGREVEAAAVPFEVDQLGCRFEPHVLLVPIGATVLYKNSDPFTHNVNVVPRRNPAMNVMVDGGSQRSAEYGQSDQVQLKCDIHPWMSGWVYVSDAPVHVLTARDGSFALPALPPGSHKVSCWHSTQGTAAGSLTVGSDGSIAELDLTFGKKKPR